jgi:hypothetical protein
MVVSHTQDFGFGLKVGNFGGSDLYPDALAVGQRVNWSWGFDHLFLVLWATGANACTCTCDCVAIHFYTLVHVGSIIAHVDVSLKSHIRRRGRFSSSIKRPLL